MKRKITWLALICVAVFLASIGSVGAYMRKQTEVKKNVFVASVVDCAVEETFKNNQKEKITVKNTGNIDAYIRLRFVTYWIDANGEILFEASPSLAVSHDTSKWTKIDDIYYYYQPVKPGEYTADLLAGSSVITLSVNGEGDNRKRQVVEVFAEAIQSIPLEAMQESWGVTENNGVITKYTN